MRKNVTLYMLFSLLHVIASAQNNTVIKLVHKVGDKTLQLHTETYFNQFNEPFTVHKFKYYITGLQIEYENGKKKYTFEKPYHLVAEEDSTTKMITLNKPLKNITTISFLLGVDSLRNVSGAQTDDLDPMKGMFWTWNTGYIYAKLEGQSDSSHAAAHYFSYHVGGYKFNENAARKIVLKIDENKQSSINEITIEADILKWFVGANEIKISNAAVCHQPGALAMMLADNYKNMFTISAIR